MTKALLTLLALAALSSSAFAQATSVTGQTQTQNQVRQQNLPPAPTCFTCDCNNQDFACNTACNIIVDFAARQQCIADCGQNQAKCLENAQRQQRAQDEQRNLTQQTTASGRSN
jgi:hypothetical protein